VARDLSLSLKTKPKVLLLTRIFHIITMASATQEPQSPKQCVGPHYRPEKQKPTATVSTEVSFPNVHTLPQTPQLIALLTMIRDKNTDRADFIFYSNRIIRLLVEEGLNHLPVVEHTVTTPVGRSYAGVMFQGKICGVSIHESW
jgi:uracil phosphoribosyltransferase